MGQAGPDSRLPEDTPELRRRGQGVLPELRELERQLGAHRETRGLGRQIAMVRKLMADIEAATDSPTLRSLDLTKTAGD